jgi:hypothetical protein
VAVHISAFAVVAKQGVAGFKGKNLGNANLFHCKKLVHKDTIFNGATGFRQFLKNPAVPINKRCRPTDEKMPSRTIKDAVPRQRRCSIYFLKAEISFSGLKKLKRF